MLFNEEEIKKILVNVDLAVTKLVINILGKEFLSKEDLALLRTKGIDLIKLLPKFPSHYQSFLFGRLSISLGEKLTSKMSYTEFEKFLNNMGLFAPNTSDIAFYKIAANKTYAHIKGLGEKIKNDINNSILAEEIAFEQVKRMSEYDIALKEEMLKGTFEIKTVKKITSNIANRVGEWDRDWGRIVETEHQDVFNMGRAQIMMENDPDPTVYFDVYPGACKHCIRLYLTQGAGSKPRLFKMSELLSNGINYGVASKDWKPTIHPVHPFCRCNIRQLLKDYEWNSENRSFQPPVGFVRKIERKGRAKIMIGDVEYNI